MAIVSRYLDANPVERLNRLELSARNVVEGSTAGLHKSPMKGSSVEFRQHRFYAPGDEPRRLDWRVLARTDRPYIKEYVEETNLRCLLMLDASGSMGYGRLHGTKYDAAARIVAALAYLMLRRTESIGLATFTEKLTGYLPPYAGASQLSRIIEHLERTQPQGVSDVPSTVERVADRLEKRSLIINVSDLFTNLANIRKAFARLNYDKHETLVLQVIDPDEQEFPFRNWMRFRGLEGEVPQLLEPAVARKTYLDNFHRHQREFVDSCRSMRVEHHLYLTDMPLADWLTRMISRYE